MNENVGHKYKNQRIFAVAFVAAVASYSWPCMIKKEKPKPKKRMLFCVFLRHDVGFAG